MEIRQILLRADTAANWVSVDPVLGAGEIGAETDTGRLKVGDGSSVWTALGYARVDLAFSRDATTVTVGASGDDAVLPAATNTLAGVMSAADKSKLDGITVSGDVESSSNNVFTGDNSFYSVNGQVFGTAVQAEDGLIVKGRDGGTEGYRVALAPAALDGNYTVQVPSRNGVLITNADTGTVTSAMLADGTIVDGDISGSAAIADTKLATIATAGKVLNAATTATSTNTASAIVARDGSGNFAAGTITASLSGNAATASAFNGTRTLSVTGDVTGSVASTFSGNVSLELDLAAGAITNADINAAAGIADSKLATISSADKVSLTALNIDGGTDIGAALADADLFVVDDGGVGTNRKAAVTRISDYTFAKVSGDITIASNGTAAIGSGVIVNGDISASAAIAHSKLASITAGQVLLGNASNVPTATALSGDVTISNAGVTAIGASKVTNAMLAGSIADSKLSTISTAGKVANSATTATNANTASAIVARDASGNFSAGTITAALSGNASTATKLATARAINGVNFDGSADITIPAAISNAVTFDNGGTGGASGSAFDGTAVLTVSYNTVGAPSTTGTGASGSWGISVTGSSASCTGNAATATNLSTNRTFALTGDITGSVSSDLSSGASITTSIASGVIVNADINASAAIADTKLATISTAGKVSGTAITSGDISTSGSIATTSTLAVGQSSAAANTDFDLAGTYVQTVVAVGALNIDCSTGNYFTKTISTNSTFTVSNVPASRAYSFTLELTHTSGTVTWFSGVEWPGGTAPTLTTGKTHLFMFVTDNGGTRWRASASVDYTN